MTYNEDPAIHLPQWRNKRGREAKRHSGQTDQKVGLKHMEAYADDMKGTTEVTKRGNCKYHTPTRQMGQRHQGVKGL